MERIDFMDAKKQLDLQENINRATVKWINEIIGIADKYSCDRNETISATAAIISIVADRTNFENYQSGGNKNA